MYLDEVIKKLSDSLVARYEQHTGLQGIADATKPVIAEFAEDIGKGVSIAPMLPMLGVIADNWGKLTSQQQKQQVVSEQQQPQPEQKPRATMLWGAPVDGFMGRGGRNDRRQNRG